MAWATIEQLEDHTGFDSNARMAECLAASLAWCNRQRPDLDPADTVPADVSRAVLIYAGLLYRERSAPQGFATYDELDTGMVDTGSAMMNVYRLLGSRKPKAR